MRIFDDNAKYQSSVTLDSVNYKLRKLKPQDGNGFMFTVEEPNKESESIHFTSPALKAIYLLITTEGK
jgi:hypothetical protein